MADDVSELALKLQTALPEVRFFLDPAFGSGAGEHRLAIRRKIAEVTGDSTVLDLNSRPQPKGCFASVSHCRTLGGFAQSSRPIGFDIEETDRVTWDIVNRMGHPQDIKGPTPAAHWSAKEAAFKSLTKNEGVILSDITILSWSEAGDRIYAFKCAQGSGIVVEIWPWTAAAVQTVSI